MAMPRRITKEVWLYADRLHHFPIPAARLLSRSGDRAATSLRVEVAALCYCAGVVVDGWVVDGWVDGAVVVGSVVDGVVVDGAVVVVDGAVVVGSVVDGCVVVDGVVAGSVVVAGGVAVSVVASFFGIRRTTRTMTAAAATIAIMAFRLMIHSSWMHPTRELYHCNQNRR
ncbi:hypothetical protein [Ensifer canadensis]|uniref:hypothetical protein n=1 Tax=Ensifer canadensis TaxID=555315 RepID=UPI0035E3C22E